MSRPDLMATLPSPLLLPGEPGFTPIFARKPEGSHGEGFPLRRLFSGDKPATNSKSEFVAATLSKGEED